MKGYKRYKGRGKKKIVTTKLYPYQIRYIDIAAEHMGMSRYKFIEYLLEREMRWPSP